METHLCTAVVEHFNELIIVIFGKWCDSQNKQKFENA